MAPLKKSVVTTLSSLLLVVSPLRECQAWTTTTKMFPSTSGTRLHMSQEVPEGVSVNYNVDMNTPPVNIYYTSESWPTEHLLTLEAILFDCDGVLADTERDGHRVAFNQAFNEKGINLLWDVERYGKLLEVAGGKERMTAHWNEKGWPNHEMMAVEEERPAKVKELHLLKTDIFNKMIVDGAIPLRPGVLRLVDEAIEKGIRLAVCSTSSEIAVTNLVKTLMGDDRASKFQIFAGDMVATKKPAPDVYNMAVEAMKLDKTRCIIVEDTEIGLAAAKAAGISCIVTMSAYAENEDFTGADMIVDELGDTINLDILTTLINNRESVEL
jgi:HAD superfamily hydrolase (TIGR01509 family)